MIEQNLLVRTPKDIAHFLHNTDGLSKKIIGEYLGEGDEFNVQVLQAFVDELDFSGLDFDVGLRRFLCKFRLPGEAQKIDRMMERFAQQFYAHNPENGVFNNSDTVYILAFSTIMLNTDAHNPNIKKKMSKQEFLSNNRGINSGEDVPAEFMETLYDKIVNDEIKMETEGNLFKNASKKGWLTKQGGKWKSWKKRWFVLSENCLFYFKAPGDAEPCGIIPLENITVTVSTKDVSKGQFKFILQNLSQDLMKACKVGSDGTLVKANHSLYFIAAQNAAEMESWITAINNNIHKNPFEELLHKKEANLTKKASANGAKKGAVKANGASSATSSPAKPNGSFITAGSPSVAEKERVSPRPSPSSSSGSSSSPLSTTPSTPSLGDR
jgi:hypothetical protein